MGCNSLCAAAAEFALDGAVRQMMVGALSGLEYIAIFAGESRQRSANITRSVWISSPIICAMFILGTGSVVAFAKADTSTSSLRFRRRCELRWQFRIGNVVAIATILLVQLRLLGAASYLFTE